MNRLLARTSASAADDATAVTRSRSVWAGAEVTGSMMWCISRESTVQRRRSRPGVASPPWLSDNVITDPSPRVTPMSQAPQRGAPHTATSPPVLTMQLACSPASSATRSAVYPLTHSVRVVRGRGCRLCGTPAAGGDPGHHDGTQVGDCHGADFWNLRQAWSLLRVCFPCRVLSCIEGRVALRDRRSVHGRGLLRVGAEVDGLREANVSDSAAHPSSVAAAMRWRTCI